MGVKTKKERREDAESRKAKFQSLSKEEKVKLIKSRPGKSKKELSRLS